MLKLIKYEFRKHLFSKILILIVLAVLELMFLVGLFLEKESLLGTSLFLFSIVTIGVMFFISYECIFTFYRELKSKQGYMLFLTPYSSYSIIGAKVIHTMLQIPLITIIYGAFVFINIGIVAAKYSKISEVFRMFQMGFQFLFDFNVSVSDIIFWLLSYLISWLSVVMLGFLAITLSMTFMANFKWKGVLSIVFFFFLNYIVFKIQDFILPNADWSLMQNSAVISGVTMSFSPETTLLSCIYMIGIMVISYFATAWMLDKKVSL